MLRVQALEGLEELVGVHHVEAGAVVLDAEHRAPAFAPGAEADARIRGARGELPGVAQQVVEQHVHQRRVGIDHEVAGDLDRHRALGLLGVQFPDHRLGQLRQIDRVAPQRLAGDGGEVDHGVDQDRHAFGGAADARELAALVDIEAVGGFLGEDAGEAVDGAQGCAQVV